MSGLDNINFEVIDSDESLLSSNRDTVSGATKTIETKGEELPFDERLKNFIASQKPCVYILTPCYGGLCYVDYVHCLMDTVDKLRKLGIQVEIEFCKNDSLVSRARNNLVARAMNNPKMTHIIFIDADISWDPMDIVKLLLSEKQLIGGIYPLKNYDWKDLIVDKTNPYNSNVVQSWINKKNQSQFKDIISDESIIQQKLLKYNVNYLDNVLNIDKNVAEVRHLATGFMMFKRSVIEKMALAYPTTKYTDDVGFLVGEQNKYAYALFDCGVEDDHYYSEDWMFCHRWTKLGGSVYIDVTINLTHTGIEDYKGSLIASLV
jgi:hypothetical protein